MGLASSVPASTRDVSESRWPPILQDVTLAVACNFYTALRELSDREADITAFQNQLGLSNADVTQVFQIFGDPACIPIWEVLVTIVFSSAKIAKKTKLLFVFRIWDYDKDQQLKISEVAFLLRTVLRGMSKYMEFDSKPLEKEIKDYVRTTFPRNVKEETFLHWGQRQPILWSTLIAFTPLSSTLPEQFDFKLVEPVRRAVPPRQTQQMQAATMSTLSAIGKFKRKAAAAQSERLQAAAAKKEQEPISICLPPMVCYGNRGRSAGRKRNKPFIHLGAQGRPGTLTMDEARASWNDVNHVCPLHNDLSECLILTRHEVFLAGRMLAIIRDSLPTISYESAKALWAFIQNETNLADSLLAQGQRQHIFKLADETNNPLFAACLKDLCSGDHITFRQYLKMLCPCASDARLDLFERWQSGQSKGWEREQEFVRMVKKWRESSTEHWGHRVLPTKRHLSFCATTGQLSIKALIAEKVVSSAMAEEVMKKHGLQRTAMLDMQSFTMYFNPGAKSVEYIGAFENAVRKREDARQNHHLTFRASTPSDYQPAASHADAIKSGNISLDEFTGSVDLRTVFGLVQVYQEEIGGKKAYPVDDFHHLRVEAAEDIEEEEV